MKRRHTALLFLAAFAMGGCASVFDESDPLAVTPYTVEPNGRVVIEVRINDRGPYLFALDTAASISAIFERTSRELGIERLPGQWALVHGAVSSQRYPLLRADRIQVGRTAGRKTVDQETVDQETVDQETVDQETWNAARVVEMPGETAAGSGIDGILGVDFLRRYAVGFDTRNRAVRLYAPARVDHPALRGWSSVPLAPQPIGGSGAALYFFEIEIAGEPVPALFDLGAGLNVLNPPAVETLRLAPLNVPHRNRVFSDVYAEAPVTGRYLAKDVRLGRVRWRNAVFSIVDLGLFETLGHGDRPAAILGAGMFSDRNFLIDFVRSRLLVRVSGHAGPTAAGNRDTRRGFRTDSRRRRRTP